MLAVLVVLAGRLPRCWAFACRSCLPAGRFGPLTSSSYPASTSAGVGPHAWYSPMAPK